MFMPFVCRIVIGKDRTFCRFPQKTHMARVGTASPLRRDRGFESPFLHRRVTCEPEDDIDIRCRVVHPRCSASPLGVDHLAGTLRMLLGCFELLPPALDRILSAGKCA